MLPKSRLAGRPLLFLCAFITLTFTFCDSSKRLADTDVNLISYQSDIRPLMVRSCTPCHFPETGRKKLLDTYNATRDNIADILVRVQLPESDEDYMPFKSKKEPFSAEEIALIQEWVEQGMRK